MRGWCRQRDVWENLECGCMRDCVLNVKGRSLVGNEESGQFLRRGVPGEFAQLVFYQSVIKNE